MNDLTDLTDDMPIADFRDEVQHRVVKYGPRSRPSKDALRFARRHSNPEFYRVASDKVHAQELYLREVYGPSRFELVIDFLNMSSLREVGITLALVSIACFGIELTRAWFAPMPSASHMSDAEVEQVAKRMVFRIADPATKNTERPTRQLGDPSFISSPAPADLEAIVAQHIDRKMAELEKAIERNSQVQSEQISTAIRDAVKGSSRGLIDDFFGTSESKPLAPITKPSTSPAEDSSTSFAPKVTRTK